MEIIFFVAIVFIGLVLRSNFQNISWHSSEIDDLERRLKVLEQKLEEKVATKSELHALEHFTQILIRLEFLAGCSRFLKFTRSQPPSPT